MKRLLVSVILALLFSYSHATILNVRKFGAAGDGKSIDSKAIDRAIEKASRHKGDTVFLPAGRYKCYSIHLKSNVTLMLDKDAVILAAATDAKHGYDDPEYNPDSLYQDFGHSHWHNSLIWGEGLHDVTICGEGLIDGGDVLTRGSGRSRHSKFVTANKALAMKNCSNVTVKGVRFLNCGHFAMLLTGVDSLLIEDVVADTNRDGIDIDCCENVVVRRCKVNTLNDDAIVLKCSYALGWAKPTANVIIEDCDVSGYDTGTFMDGTKQTTVTTVPDRDGPTGRIKLGTESSTAFRNVMVRNCRFNHCRGIAIETVDGAPLENVEFSDIEMNDICNSPIYIRLGDRMRSPKGTAPSSVNGVRINNVTVKDADARYACLIYGMEGNPIRNVSISNLTVEYRGGLTVADYKEQRGRNTFFSSRNESTYPEPSAHGIQPAWGWSLQHVDGLRMKNVRMSVKAPDERPQIYQIDVRNMTVEDDLSSVPGNPIITNMYSADPSAHVFGDTLWLYPSHDRDDAASFSMEDYHAYSTTDMVTWVDHGVIFNPILQTTWAKSAAWAPDCICRNGKYYLYYPTDKRHIGVAVSDSPSGPFVDPLGHPLLSIDSPGVVCDRDFIDPCVFIDDDGQAYLFVGQNTVCCILLNEDMISYDGKVHIIEGARDFFEAAWVHKRDGVYYLSYSDGPFHGHEPQIAYCTSSNILGPYTYRGVILDPVNSGTNHHSIVNYNGKDYLFYHTADLSRYNCPDFHCGVRRSVCVDPLYYNADGTIQKVKPTININKVENNTVPRYCK